MSGLRDLDDRIVPRAAARLRALVDAGTARREAVRRRAASVVSPPPAGAPPGPLQRLDDRFARRGPLAVVRDVPQVGLAVIAAVFLAGAGVALARSGDTGPPSPRAVQVEQESRVLGPQVGADVEEYLDATQARAARLSRERPEALHVALVSLDEYGRPEEVRALLQGLEVQRAFLRVPATEADEVLSADVQDLVGDLRLLYASTATRKAEDQEEFLRLARSIDPEYAEQEQFEEFYERAARVAGQEATAYRTGCACLFAVVVRGTADALAELQALQGVRAVELAPRGVSLEELRVRPLAPEQTETIEPDAVPRLGRGGG